VTTNGGNIGSGGGLPKVVREKIFAWNKLNFYFFAKVMNLKKISFRDF
jgi:hypothetical protein